VTREYQSPPLGTIKVKNSPLWQADLDQQFHYYGTRAWARRWRSSVILGIYTVEEAQEAAQEITSEDRRNAITSRGDVLDDEETHDPDAPLETAPLHHRFSYALEQIGTDVNNEGALQRIFLKYQSEIEATGPEARTKLRGIYELHLRRLRGDVGHEEAMELSRAQRAPEQ
jgi:hypothetical protein